MNGENGNGENRGSGPVNGEAPSPEKEADSLPEADWPEEEWMADDWQDDDWQEGPEPGDKRRMILVFLALVAVAALICALLWGFTHRGEPDPGAAGDSIPVVTESPVPESPVIIPEGSDGENEESSLFEETPEPSKTPEAGRETEEPAGTPEAAQTPEASNPGTQQGAQAPTDGDGTMSFQEVQESVTPKDVINLRSVPSTVDETTIVVQISNGEVLSRTGINGDTGWSRVEYNGQTLYAVSQYLTTDLSYEPPVQAADPNRVITAGGRVILFENCDDYMTPKEYVNLRTEPSTSEGDATVRCQVSSGEAVHRTGYSADYGWSRVEYNGETLYVVTSLMKPQ